MIIQPRRAHLAAEPDTLKTLPSDSGQLVLECEATAPPSAAGRTVYLCVTAEQVPALLKAARSVAISARQQPMSTGGRTVADDTLAERLAAIREPPEVLAAPVGEVRTERCVAYGGDDAGEAPGAAN